MTQEPQTDTSATRRGMLAGVGLVGLAGAITACGAGSSSSSSASGGAAPATPASSASSASSTSSAAGGSGGSAATALTTTSKVPVGGGEIIAASKVVVTQPTKGEFKAFSAICTHMGCTVSQVANGTIDCPCHGSQYNITTGAVVAGPAPKPLPAKQIKVSGDSIFLE